MGIEIERKFLVNDISCIAGCKGSPYKQGYLSTAPDKTIRIRIAHKQGFLTIKGKAENISRVEFEYAIPLSDAEALIALCDKPLIEKERYEILHEGKIWEVDIFHGDNEGLIVAEIELESETEKISLPAWLGPEVSHDERYFNSNLSKMPYKNW